MYQKSSKGFTHYFTQSSQQPYVVSGVTVFILQMRKKEASEKFGNWFKVLA